MVNLNNHGGKFTSLAVQRRGKVTAYCAKIKKITDKTITFLDCNTREIVKTNLENLV